MTGTPTPGEASARLVLSCVGENRPDWFVKIQNLVLSVRLFGGAMSDVPFVVHLVGGARPEFVGPLEELSARVEVVQPMDPRMPNANKMRMFDLGERDDFDVLVALDCDLIVMGDLAPEASTTHVRVRPARSPFPSQLWQQIYASGGLVQHVPAFTAPASGASGPDPYFNPGVVLVPREMCLPLARHWNAQRDRLLALEAERPGLLRTKAQRDGPSFVCALAASGLPVDPLPLNLNLPVRGPKLAREQEEWGPPFIFHYHDWIDSDGFLMRSEHPRVVPHLEEFNRARASALGVPYHRQSAYPVSRRLRRELRRLERRGRLLGRRAWSALGRR